MNIEEYKQKSLKVDEIISGIVEEFARAINLLKNDSKLVRIRLLIAFSFAEVVCIVFDKYYNLNLPNSSLMKKWFKEYCLTGKNEVYKNHQYFKKIDEGFLYELRCSIMHAFALPEYMGKYEVMFPNGIETAQNIKRIDENLTNAGLNPVFVSPDSMTALFIKGFRILHEEMFVSENALTSDNFAGMERVHTEFFRRGAKSIQLDN